MNSYEYFEQYKKEAHLETSTHYIESFHFELTEMLSNQLLQLVLEGKKKATASSKYYYQIMGERIPKVGDYSVVTDFYNQPKCVIQTTNVMVLPFKDITYDLCQLEGEDDTLESWREGHQRFFTNEGASLGYAFSEDMPVIFEQFKVVYQ